MLFDIAGFRNEDTNLINVIRRGRGLLLTVFRRPYARARCFVCTRPPTRHARNNANATTQETLLHCRRLITIVQLEQ